MHLMFITFTRTHFWTSRNWPDPPKYRWHSVLGSCSSSSLSIKRQCPSFPCHGTQVPSLSVPCLMSVLQAPVVISRDHHDVSGTDSPFRETSNIYDGSAFTAGILGSPPMYHFFWLYCTYFDRYGRAKLHWRRIQRCNLGCFAQRWRMRLVSFNAATSLLF